MVTLLLPSDPCVGGRRRSCEPDLRTRPDLDWPIENWLKEWDQTFLTLSVVSTTKNMCVFCILSRCKILGLNLCLFVSVVCLFLEDLNTTKGVDIWTGSRARYLKQVSCSSFERKTTPTVRWKVRSSLGLSLPPLMAVRDLVGRPKSNRWVTYWTPFRVLKKSQSETSTLFARRVKGQNDTLISL